VNSFTDITAQFVTLEVNGKDDQEVGKMQYKVDPKIQKLCDEGVKYIAEFLDLVDTRKLYEFKIRQSDSARAIPCAYGNCKSPRRSSILGGGSGQTAGFRISVSLKGSDDDFPWAPGSWGRRGYLRHAGEIHHGHVGTTLAEQMVFVSGHEFLHYAALSGLCPVRYSQEYNADRFGYDMMHSFREGVDPVFLAEHFDTNICHDPGHYAHQVPTRIAHQRAPYAALPPTIRKGI
jgi:hypothetical protein